MVKKQKRFLILLITAVIVVAGIFAGCGQKTPANVPSVTPIQPTVPGFNGATQTPAILPVQTDTPPSVTTVGAFDITANTAVLRGSFDSMGSAPAVNISFQWGTAPGSYSNETPPSTMGTTAPFQANVTGLTSGTAYYYRAKASGSGTSYGAEKSFIAGRTGISSNTTVVTTENATNINSNSAILKGNIGTLGNLTSLLVSFQWGTNSDSYTKETTETTMGTAGAFQFNLTGLNSGTTYYYRVKGTNGQTTVYGSEVIFTTANK